jgi:dTDP-4-dehydrorhamnose reductase
MTLLVFGKTGQVARELQRLLPQAHFLGRDEADLANPAACAAAIAASNAAAVINAAAWTAVDKAETEEAAATMVNGDCPRRHGAGRRCQGHPLPSHLDRLRL